MSGGSHGYLCHALDRDQHPFDENWDSFIALLRSHLPVQMAPILGEMVALAAEMDALQEAFYTFFAEHTQRLHAVEWWASGDWGPEQVVQAFAEAK